MKNVIVFTFGAAHYAIELRWVRELTKLGPVTPVPGAPPTVAGVASFRGAIMPVLSLPESNHDRPPRAGDGVILIEVDGACAALRVDVVLSVSTLQEGAVAGTVSDPRHDAPIPMLDPPMLVARATVTPAPLPVEPR